MRGSIRKRGSGWQVRVYAGVYDSSGAKRTISRTVHGTKREAEDVLNGLLLEVGDGRHLPSGLTVGDLLDQWWELKRPTVSPTTAKDWDSCLRLHICPRHRGNSSGGLARKEEAGHAWSSGCRRGSVYKNAEGLWCASVELGRGPDGRRRRKVVKARTKSAALTKAAELRSQAPDLQARVSAGRPLVDRRLTVARLPRLVAHRRGRNQGWAAGDLTPGSSSRYHQVVRLYLKPTIGTVPAQLGPDHVHGLLRNLESKGLSPSTVAQVRKRPVRQTPHACRPPPAATLLLDQGVPLEVVSAILGHAGIAITAVEAERARTEVADLHAEADRLDPDVGRRR